MNPYTKDDWLNAVANEETTLGLDDWLEQQADAAEEQAYQDMLAELESGDCAVIQCDGFRTTVTFCRKELPVGEDEDAFAALAAEMERRKYWPNIYHINDHGNVTLCDKDGNHIKGWV